MEPTPPRKFTDEVLSDEMAAILRAKTPTERLKMAFDLWTARRDSIRQTARAQHLEWTEQELNRHVAERMSRETD